MASTRKLLTIFGATGNQGGSVIDTVLAIPDLSVKYSLRGITRDPASSKSQALTFKGVEMVTGELNDPASLEAAVKGSHGVFGVTDFWAVMSKEVEMKQGISIFEACKKAGVKHYVWSSLPDVTKMSVGKYTHVDHFDSKAAVEEHIEGHKGDMVASYMMPAMFMSFAETMIKPVNGTPTLSLPFPSDTIAWPLVDPRRDCGKYVMGFFEAGSASDGAHAQAASWTTPREVVAALSNKAGKEVVFNPIPGKVFASFLPEPVRDELTQMMEMIGELSYYGKGKESEQVNSDQWIVRGAEKTASFEAWVKEHGPLEI